MDQKFLWLICLAWRWFFLVHVPITVEADTLSCDPSGVINVSATARPSLSQALVVLAVSSSTLEVSSLCT